MIKFKQMPIDKVSLINNLKNKKKEIENKYTNRLDYFLKISENLGKVCESIKESWTGSCIGYHSKLYYGDFEKPPIKETFNIEWGGINGFSNKWKEYSPSEVKQKIELLMGDKFSMDEFEKEIKDVGQEIENLQNYINIQTETFTKGNSTHPLVVVEKYEYSEKLKSYVKSYVNRQWMSRDTKAFSQGIMVPSIIYYEGIKYEAQNLIDLSKKLFKGIDLFIDWYDINNPGIPSNLNNMNLSLLHPDIYTNCQTLYESGQYAEAVEKGFKVVKDKLRDLTAFETGSEAFGKGKLHIKGAAAQNVDKDFNEGAKFLTMSIDFFRNEKSHTSKAKIDNIQKAYEYLALSSLAMNLLDNAEIKTI